MVIELAGDDFVGDVSDQIASFLVQKLQLDIRHGCRFFKDAESLDKLSRHRVPPRPCLKIFERTLCLGAPVTIRGDCDFAHGILFDARLSHCVLLSWRTLRYMVIQVVYRNPRDLDANDWLTNI